MNNFVQRTLSGAVYVGVVVSSILVHPAYFGIVFLLISMLAVREFMSLMQMGDESTFLSILLAGILFAGGWLFAQGYARAGGVVWMIWGVLGMLTLITELFLKAEHPIHNWGNILQSQMMIALPFTLMNGILLQSKYVLLALFIAIWVNDSGAYIIGSLMAKRPGGNHKMFARVSPNKSWEGLMGGIVFTLIAGWVFYAVGWFSHIGIALIFAAVVSVFGTLGDLMESLMKRTLGVKDSGRFMPGHGGVLDRFDSILLATPAIFLLIVLTYYN